MISAPHVVADVDAERYLVAMLGEHAHWVQNVRAAAGRVILRQGRRETVRLEEVDPGDRPPILRRYVNGARPGDYGSSTTSSIRSSVRLRSRFRGRLGRAVALLTYRGPISGREITIPVQLVRDASGCYVGVRRTLSRLRPGDVLV